MDKLLSLKKVSLNIPLVGYQVVSDVTFDVKKNDFIILLGGNGSGKSSMLKLINKTYEMTSGSISFKNKNIKKYHKFDKEYNIVTLTQDTKDSLFCDMTILENCIMWGTAYKYPNMQVFTNSDRQLYSEYLKNFGGKLYKKMDVIISNLSGGEKQLLILALCLFKTPDLLLLDEHTSALDPNTAEKVISKTYDEIIKNDITCIMATHNLEHALRYGNKLIALRDGSVVFSVSGLAKKKISMEDLVKFCY